MALRSGYLEPALALTGEPVTRRRDPLRIDARGAMRDGDLLGRILETFVAAQLRPELAVSATRPRLHHLRTAEGRHEVDLVAELPGGDVVASEGVRRCFPAVAG